LAAHQPAPDVIALQELYGYLGMSGPRRCAGLPFLQGIANYDQLDQIVAQLYRHLGFRYRIAYLTGHPYQWPQNPYFGTPVCTAYSAQAMLYRSDVLHNRTAERQCSNCLFAEHWEAWTDTPNLRLSLPFCNRGATLSGVSLGSLIDGERIDTPDCGRVPGGAVWAVFPPRSEIAADDPSRSGAHIVATAVEFTFADDPSTGVVVVNAHPNSGHPDRDRAPLEALVSRATSEFRSSWVPYFPPVLTGDPNEVNVSGTLAYPFRAVTQGIAEEPVMTFVGDSEEWNATYPGVVAEAVFAPEAAHETRTCPGPKDKLLGEHCGLLTRLD
jgi:hypothetical protein